MLFDCFDLTLVCDFGTEIILAILETLGGDGRVGLLFIALGCAFDTVFVFPSASALKQFLFY